jgi:hypothetical protein
MHHVPPNNVEFYNDTADWPQTPGQQAAERVYRNAFLAAAREAGQWDKIDHAALAKAWAERRQVRESARVLYPSAKMYGCPEMQSDQIIYREGHEVEAARTRGRVHGFELVRQCWDELVMAGVEQARIGPVIIRPWIESVAKWVARDIDPERICPPPRPDDMTERQRRMLSEACAKSATAAQSRLFDFCSARPHPPCADGAKDGELAPARRMVLPPSALRGWSRRSRRNEPAQRILRSIRTRRMGAERCFVLGCQPTILGSIGTRPMGAS